MDTVNSDPATTLPDVSLVRGGPFYRIQRALGLIREPHWNFGRRLILLIAIGWLPLLLITAILNPPGLHSFISEYRLHSRLLIAVPALLLGEIYMESRFRAAFVHLHRSGLLDEPDLAYMNSVVTTIARLRDAVLPEMLVLALIVVRTIATYKGLVDATPWLGSGVGASFQLTAAGWYAVVVSAPLFQFLLALGLWNWLLWTFFAFKLSRQNLRLMATHPDLHGGLGFLGVMTSAFAPVTFAVSAVIGATWRHDILNHGAHLVNFRMPVIVLAVTILILALAPLLFFVPRLARLRRVGILEYGTLAQTQSIAFREKWILRNAPRESAFLQSPDASALSNFADSFERITKLNPFPADLTSLYGLAAAIALPALPVILAEIPVGLVLADLFKALR
jgi:hypothetical protein